MPLQCAVASLEHNPQTGFRRIPPKVVKGLLTRARRRRVSPANARRQEGGYWSICHMSARRISRQVDVTGTYRDVSAG